MRLFTKTMAGTRSKALSLGKTKNDLTRSDSGAGEDFFDLLRTCSVSEIRKPTTDQHLDDGKYNRGRDAEH